MHLINDGATCVTDMACAGNLMWSVGKVVEAQTRMLWVKIPLVSFSFIKIIYIDFPIPASPQIF